MKLADYLAMTNTAVATLAESIGVEIGSAYRYVAGDRIPHPKVMARIVAETKGAVQPNDFYPAPAK